MTDAVQHQSGAHLVGILEQRLADGRLELPVLPEVALEILGMTANANCDARALADLVRRDQALAGHVLRISNSPAYMPREPIASLQQAVSRLGFAALREMAVAVSVHARVFDFGSFEREARDLWRHSVATAAFSKEIARTRRRNVDQAFLCGLLHDIGKPIALKAVVELANASALDLDAAMGAVESLHARIGAELGAKWNLPPAVIACARCHHATADAGEHRDIVTMVALADTLAARHVPGGEISALCTDEAVEAICGELNIYPEDRSAIEKRLPEIVRVVEAIAS